MGNDDRVYGAIQSANTPNISVIFICVFIALAIIDQVYSLLKYYAKEYDVHEIYENFQYKIFGKLLKSIYS